MSAPKRHLNVRTRLAVALGIVLLVAGLVSRIDFRRTLAHQKVAVLSGSPDGNHYLIVERLGQAAAAQQGKVSNLTSDGSLENVDRLEAAARSCQAQFALVQDGVEWPKSPELQLIGRLPKAESALLLGRHADSIHELADLAHLKIGVGPAGSGTGRAGHQIFESPDFRDLGITLSFHPFAEQLDRVGKGDLDLAFFVIDENAPLIESAIRDRGMQIADFAHAEAIARRIPHLSVGTITAGLYDPVRVLPRNDKTVLRVQTLVVGNGCAGRSQVVSLLDLLASEFPDFIRYNRETANGTGLLLSQASQSFFEHQGPELADQYAPWLVDVMPPANWAYVVAGVSLLFNLMGFGHRFQLYRIDANRVKIEREITQLFGNSTTLAEIARMEPDEKMRQPAMKAAVQETIHQLVALHMRSRHFSVSFIVPMGQEMAYRYQESLIHEILSVLRGFLHRCEAAEHPGAGS